MASTSICVFCGAQNAVPREHLDMGKELGQFIGKNGYHLVYGGGDCGVMGSVSNAVMNHGGTVTGVFPRNLHRIEKENQNLTEIILVDTMHERKRIMYERSDVFVILPGGFGTLDELFEILTWKQLQLHNKPILIFNYLGYWDHLIALMSHIIDTGFAREINRSYYQVITEYDELIAVIEQ